MNESLAEQYGPNSGLVRQFIAEVRTVPWFKHVGRPLPVGAVVHRLTDWEEFGRAMKYDLDWPESRSRSSHPFLEPVDIDECPFIRFLGIIRQLDEANTRVAERRGLSKSVALAVEDACAAYRESEPGDQDLPTYIGAVPENLADDWENTVEAHVAFTATEIVMSHLTQTDLLRRMWPWYRSGHWPCGWEGTWPEGCLIVF
jgi:hypothetical protein